MRIIYAIQALLETFVLRAVGAPVTKSALPSKPNPVWNKEPFNF